MTYRRLPQSGRRLFFRKLTENLRNILESFIARSTKM